MRSRTRTDSHPGCTGNVPAPPSRRAPGRSPAGPLVALSFSVVMALSGVWAVSAAGAVRPDGRAAPQSGAPGGLKGESEEHAVVARELRRLHVEESVPWAELAVVVRRQRERLAGLLRALDDAAVPRATPEARLSLLSQPATHPYLLALRWLARPEERDALLKTL